MSQHFSIDEFTRSKVAQAQGIDNTPPIAVLKQLPFTMAGMERIRAYLGYPCTVTSGFRCVELNQWVVGAKDSQHLTGEACDFVCPGFSTPLGVAKELAGNMQILGIDQLILEDTWVHVSFTLMPRYEVLTARFGKYEPGIVS